MEGSTSKSNVVTPEEEITIPVVVDQNNNNNSNNNNSNNNNSPDYQSELQKPISIYLMGDSIFDNAPYTMHVHSCPEVIQQLWMKCTRGKNRTYEPKIVALDGDVIEGIPRQKERIPQDADYIFISVGGNDLLRLRGKIDSQGYGMKTIWEALSFIRHELSKEYEDMVSSLIESHPNCKISLATIYTPLFSQWREKALASLGLWFFNSYIRSVATKFKLPILDISAMFTEDKDYANPIEPSSWGGDKITSAMMNIIEKHNFNNESLAYTVYEYIHDPLSPDPNWNQIKDQVYNNRNYTFFRKTEENDPFRN